MSQCQYAYHCTNMDPEIIKREGWKVGSGFTIENMFDDLYEKYLPKVPVFVSNDGKAVWDTNAKYIIKLDITGLDLYPDFGSLPDTGAYYDPDEECFYWQDGFRNPEMEKYVSEYMEKYASEYEDDVLYAEDFSGEDCMAVLGTACVDGNKLQGRIVSYMKKDETMKLNESSLNIKQVTYADVEKHLQEVESWNPEDQRGKDGRPYNTTQFTKNASNSAMEWWFAYDGRDLVAVVGMDPKCKGEGEVYLNEIMAKAGGGYGVKTMKWLFDHYAKQPGVKVLSFDSWSANNMDKLSAHYEKNFPDFKKEKNAWGGYKFTKNLEDDDEGQEELDQVDENTKFTLTIGQLKKLIRESLK